MARIRFEDELGTQGEMDVADLQAGDVVRLQAEFEKHGDDDQDAVTRIPEGTLGEVIDVFPDMPGVMCECPCTVEAMGSSISGDRSVLLDPAQLVVVVNAQDPRIGGHRITGAELDAQVRSLGLPPVCATHRRVVIAALVMADLKRAARVVAQATAEAWEAWQTDMRAGSIIPILLWALDGDSSRLAAKEAVAEALERLSSRLKDEDAEPWDDVEAEIAALRREVGDLASEVSSLTDDEWRESLEAFDEDLVKPHLTEAGVGRSHALYAPQVEGRGRGPGRAFFDEASPVRVFDKVK